MATGSQVISMSSGLRISENLALPSDAVTQTFGLLAVRGAGKTNAARVMAEEMFAARLPFVAIDPVGSWWGLRSSADAKAPGLAIPIFGGKHGEVPLERGAGDMLVDLVVSKRLSCVIDLSLFDSEADKKAFLLAFARRLYLKNEDPLHLFLEEADDYIPQKPMRDEAQLLRAWENIVRRGRGRGLGMTLITQRSAAINKMVLTQCETLIALRTTSPQDRAAIEAWVKYHAQSQEIIESLSGLANGEAWVWSPHFLGLTKRIRFRMSRTFDSGATPKNVSAEQRRAPATMADIDLGEVRSRMADTIEKAKAEDPRELRKRIAALEAELRKVRSAAPAADPDAIARAEERGRRAGELMVETLREQALKFHQVVLGDLDHASGALDQARRRIGDTIVDAGIETGLLPPNPERQNLTGRSMSSKAVAAPAIVKRKERALGPVHSSGSSMAAGERKILTALAQYPDGRRKAQIAILAGYAVNGGGFNNYLSSLRSKGWIEGSEPVIRITDAGVRALGNFTPLPTGRALLEYWCGQLGRAERMILEYVTSIYPRGASKDQVGEATEYEPNGGGFNNALSRLRTLELITGRGEIRASEDLF